ncbi:MAG: zinc-dependent peptidase [Saprospiraceae bacterium]|nr:zinc-dependent peptidase [Saprospiraceae bacterium]
MPTRLLAIPFAVGFFLFFYLAWARDEAFAIYIIPCSLILGLMYVFSPQIDWWWYKRNPPDLTDGIRRFFGERYTYYMRLPLREKEPFRHKVAMFSLATDFKPMVMPEVPGDVRAIVSASAVQLSAAFDDFLYSPFENVVIYPHPFPSPQYPEHFHLSEIFEEDGVILFSMDHLIKSFAEPERYYNIGLHEFAKVFMLTYPDKAYPELADNIWEDLEQISQFSKAAILEWINLPEIDPLPVSIAHFFVFPERFKEVLPGIYQTYTTIFQQDPAGPV